MAFIDIRNYSIVYKNKFIQIVMKSIFMILKKIRNQLPYLLLIVISCYFNLPKFCTINVTMATTILQKILKLLRTLFSTALHHLLLLCFFPCVFRQRVFQELPPTFVLVHTPKYAALCMRARESNRPPRYGPRAI